MSDDVYRLRVGIALSANGSTGDWRHYDSIEALETALVDAHIDVVAYGREGNRSRIARAWRRLRTGESYPRVSNIFHVEKHTADGWIELPHKVIEPHVEWVPERTDAGHGE